MTTVILRTTARLVTPIIGILSVYLLLRGHNAPGGGFIAALVGGAAVVLRWLAGTQHRWRVPQAALLLGSGLLVAVGTGLAGLVLGGDFLEGAIGRWTLPLIGEVKVTASLAFDAGVYLVVLAMIVAIVSYLGGEDQP